MNPAELDSESLEREGSGVSSKTSGPGSQKKESGGAPVASASGEPSALSFKGGEPGSPVGPLPPVPTSRRELHLAPLDASARGQAEGILRATGVFREDEILVGLEVLDSYLEHPEQDYTALGAFTPGGELLGFSIHGPTPCTLGTWDLYWIAVSPEAQGLGVGTVLLKEVEGRLTRSNARLLVIETSSRPPYEPTRAFYLKKGYREVARVPDFYEAGDDRVIYAKNLTV